jgi:enoyl-CoA hydratase/carnithine racemase
MQHEDAIGVSMRLHPSVPSTAILEMCRPAKSNALRPQDLRQFNAYMAECQADPNIKLIVITGTGVAFTGGADIRYLNRLSGDELAAFIDLQLQVLIDIVTTPKIVLAAVNGDAAGMGNHIAICSDLCIAREGVTFNFTGAAKGLPSLLFGTLMLPLTIGMKKAKAIYLRGGAVTAEQAVQHGFCNEVVSGARWEEAVEALGREFAERSSMTMAHNKYQLNQPVLQLIGAAKLSGLAGSASLASATEIPTGRLDRPSGRAGKAK